MLTGEIQAISHAEYYQQFIAMMSAADQKHRPVMLKAKSYPSFQTMLEQMLLADLPIIDSIDALLLRQPQINPAHREKLRAVLEWKRAQLQARATIFGNEN